MSDIKVIKGARLSLPNANLEGLGLPQFPSSPLAVEGKITSIDKMAVAVLEIQSLTGRSPEVAERGLKRIFSLAESHPVSGHELLQEWKRRVLSRSWGKSYRRPRLRIFVRDN